MALPLLLPSTILDFNRLDGGGNADADCDADDDEDADDNDNEDDDGSAVSGSSEEAAAESGGSVVETAVTAIATAPRYFLKCDALFLRHSEVE